MQKTRVILCAMMLAAACSKSDKGSNPTGGAGLTATISTQISKTDSLTIFNKFFKANSLSDADIADGVTVFAPSNAAFGNASVTGAGELPDGSSAKDYIVRGVLKEADFTKGKTLTTLSGKTLTVSVVADPIILVNGMIINVSPAGTGDKFVVYGAAQLLNAPAPIFFTVYDANSWSASKPRGNIVAGADVLVYKSRETFTNSAQPDYTGKTDKDGVAQINGVVPGTYYVAVGKGITSNIFKLYEEKTDGLYLGYAADTVLDDAGKLKWLDLNQDGVVNKQDMSQQPWLTITTEKGKVIDLPVIIGNIYKPLTTKEDVQGKLNEVYNGLTSFYTNLVLMDGVLSDESGCGFSSALCPLDNFTMTPAMSIFNSIWSDGYFKGIHQLNYVIGSIGNLAISQDEANDLLGQALAMRAYIYTELLTYWGDVPQSNADRSTDFYPGISRTAVNDLYTAASADLSTAVNYLPATRTDGKASITKYAALGIMAKLALQKKDWTVAANASAAIINTSSYSLTSLYGWLTSQNSAETIWAPPFSNIGAANAGYYDGAFGSTQPQFIPVLRYADILLIHAEAQIELGNLSSAQQDINLLRIRRSMNTIDFANVSEARDGLNSISIEQYRQGWRYANLVRRGTAQQALGGNWSDMKGIMPLPQNFLVSYFNLVQSPGY